MRYFLTRRLPETNSILLVESGSRSLLEGLIGHLRDNWGEEIPIDLVTCYSGLPKGFDPATTHAYGVRAYRSREGRSRLYQELAQKQYSLMGIVCSDEPILFKWKLVLAAKVRAKVFIINENGDYFWLDIGHLKPLREFLLLRSGLGDAGAARILTRLVTFPFTMTYLLGYAAMVHARRALRKA